MTNDRLPPGRNYSGQPSVGLTAEFFAKLLDASPGAVFEAWFRPDGTMGFEFMSHKVESIFGISADELLERPMRMFDLIPPEDRVALFERSVNNDGATPKQTFTDRYLGRDGEIRWVRTTTATEPVGPDGARRYYCISTDVTAEETSRRALEATNARLSALVDATPDAIWTLETVFDALNNPVDFRVTDFNRGACRMFLTRKADVVGKTVTELARVNPSLTCLDLYLATFRQGRAVREEELEIQTPRGRRWVDRQIVPLPFGLAVMTRDVTEARLANEGFRESQARFSQMADHLDAAFWLNEIDPPRILYMSPAFERITGISVADVTRDPLLWRHAIHPDDRDRVVVAFERWLRLEEDYDVDYQLLRSDGQWRWLRDVGNRIRDEKGNVYRLAGLTRDVTTEREARARLAASEERYRGVFSASHEGIALIDIEGKIVEANERMGDILGCAPAQMRGRSLAWWIDPTQLADTSALLGLDRPQSRMPQTIRFMRPDKSIVHTQVSFADLPREAGGRVQRMIMVADVTLRVVAEDEMRKRDQEIAHAGRLMALGEMVAEMAHDINQPLYAASNFANACAYRLTNESEVNRELILGHLASISKTVDRAANVVRRVLNFVRKSEPDLRATDLNERIHDTIALVESTTRRKGIEFHTVLDTSLPLIEVDAVQVEQVLMNLLRNAVEAIEQAQAESATAPAKNSPPKRVIVTSRRIPDGIRIGVEDNGPGVSPEDLPRIFEAFYTTKDEGTGLGLSICRRIIESHNGKITCEPRAYGVEFVIVLPLA